jgi:hypothetical protein
LENDDLRGGGATKIVVLYPSFLILYLTFPEPLIKTIEIYEI